MVLGDVVLPETEESREAVLHHLPGLSHSKRSSRFIELIQGAAHDVRDVTVGVVFNGRQAPGGHNVIDGLLRAFRGRSGCKIIGFLNGTSGIAAKSVIEITEDNFRLFRNTGGFDMLGRTADQIRSPEQQEAAKNACISLNLDGLVLVGASHTMTDAANLCEYFKA
jgi:pyrophosphate--fructose-6-phosphate 1-phosphotransferase